MKTITSTGTFELLVKLTLILRPGGEIFYSVEFYFVFFMLEGGSGVGLRPCHPILHVSCSQSNWKDRLGRDSSFRSTRS
jgi:hypothetical protein